MFLKTDSSFSLLQKPPVFNVIFFPAPESYNYFNKCIERSVNCLYAVAELVLFAICCVYQKPSLARTSLVRVFDTNTRE